MLCTTFPLSGKGTVVYLPGIEFCIRYHGVHDVILMSCIFLVLCACAIESVCPHVLSVNISLFGVLNKSK